MGLLLNSIQKQGLTETKTVIANDVSWEWGVVFSFLQFGHAHVLPVFRHDYERVLLLSGSITVTTHKSGLVRC